LIYGSIGQLLTAAAAPAAVTAAAVLAGARGHGDPLPFALDRRLRFVFGMWVWEGSINQSTNQPITTADRHTDTPTALTASALSSALAPPAKIFVTTRGTLLLKEEAADMLLLIDCRVSGRQAL
jgi:hypothetical protein